jgi:hypothetical protein
MSAKEEIEQMQKVLLNMSRLAKRRAKKHSVNLVYGLDGKVVFEKIDKTPAKK